MFGVRSSSGHTTSLHQSLLSIKVGRSANIAEWLLKLQNVTLLGPNTASHSWWQANTGTHWHFAFELCCHSNETHAPITNPPNTAQLGGIRYHSPKLYPGPCNSVGPKHAAADRQTHRHGWQLYISHRLRFARNVTTACQQPHNKPVIKINCNYEK